MIWHCVERATGFPEVDSESKSRSKSSCCMDSLSSDPRWEPMLSWLAPVCVSWAWSAVSSSISVTERRFLKTGVKDWEIILGLLHLVNTWTIASQVSPNQIHLGLCPPLRRLAVVVASRRDASSRTDSWWGDDVDEDRPPKRLNAKTQALESPKDGGHLKHGK